MPVFLKGSFIVSLIAAVLCSFKRGYDNSHFKGFVCGCSLCLKSSCVYGIVRRYFYKPAYFEDSLTYRIILWLVKLFDVPVGLIGSFVRYIIKGSCFIGSATALADAPLKYRFVTGGIIGLFIAAGYSVGILIKGAAAAAFIPPLVIACTAVIVFVVANTLEWIKNSVIYRVITWFTTDN